MRQNRLRKQYLIKYDYLVIKSNQSKNAKTPYFQGKLAMCRGFKSPSRYLKTPQSCGVLFFRVAFCVA